MKFYEYLKTSIFDQDMKIMIFKAVYIVRDVSLDRIFEGTYNDLKLQDISQFLDSYIAGQSITGKTVYVVCTQDPNYEGIGLRGFKFRSDSLGFLNSLIRNKE